MSSDDCTAESLSNAVVSGADTPSNFIARNVSHNIELCSWAFTLFETITEDFMLVHTSLKSQDVIGSYEYGSTLALFLFFVYDQ